uniref:Uncharacterized protein n=1 Tax=Hyaloperonospora arabidopsidis (strain Emoy2) TaxID=559515 RepID=M4BG27_HYAAE
MGNLIPFQSAHALQFGIKVNFKDAKGSTICWCRFCMHEGRDEVEVGQNDHKRKNTGIIKMFPAPFYPHEYLSHLEYEHTDLGGRSTRRC